ncbi:hypothetical protein P4V41_07160 [Fictibacillus nanhaiensis]|uniref:hypothetical protein n=1 Tax=Fictibacillus nanhaiensis TaxID=742169 RepID=UPI002E1E1206|nr:hypothetical protein [Fictibacillus nanhaiensis]
MVESDIQLKLLAGLPISIDGLGQLRQLPLKEIVNMDESVYNQHLSVLLFDKTNIEQLQDQDASNYEMLIAVSYQDINFREMFIKGLELFFNEKANFFFNENYAFFYLGEIDEERVLSAERLETMQKLLKKINNLQEKKEEEAYNPGNEMARKFIEKLKKIKAEAPKKKESINLHSLVSGLAWKSHSININSIWDLTIYQIYDGFSRTQSIENYDNVMRGIYAGTINGKDIDLSKINWANIIKIN